MMPNGVPFNNSGIPPPVPPRTPGGFGTPQTCSTPNSTYSANSSSIRELSPGGNLSFRSGFGSGQQAPSPIRAGGSPFNSQTTDRSRIPANQRFAPMVEGGFALPLFIGAPGSQQNDSFFSGNGTGLFSPQNANFSGTRSGYTPPQYDSFSGNRSGYTPPQYDSFSGNRSGYTPPQYDSFSGNRSGFTPPPVNDGGFGCSPPAGNNSGNGVVGSPIGNNLGNGVGGSPPGNNPGNGGGGFRRGPPSSGITQQLLTDSYFAENLVAFMNNKMDEIIPNYMVATLAVETPQALSKFLNDNLPNVLREMVLKGFVPMPKPCNCPEPIRTGQLPSPHGKPQGRVVEVPSAPDATQCPGGINDGTGGIIQGPGGIMDGPGGIIDGPGGIIQCPGGMAQGSGGMIDGSGGSIRQIRPKTNLVDNPCTDGRPCCGCGPNGGCKSGVCSPNKSQLSQALSARAKPAILELRNIIAEGFANIPNLEESLSKQRKFDQLLNELEDAAQDSWLIQFG